jgi:hypothetical protein
MTSFWKARRPFWKRSDFDESALHLRDFEEPSANDIAQNTQTVIEQHCLSPDGFHTPPSWQVKVLVIAGTA